MIASAMASPPPGKASHSTCSPELSSRVRADFLCVLKTLSISVAIFRSAFSPVESFLLLLFFDFEANELLLEFDLLSAATPSGQGDKNPRQAPRMTIAMEGV